MTVIERCPTSWTDSDGFTHRCLLDGPHLREHECKCGERIKQLSVNLDYPPIYIALPIAAAGTIEVGNVINLDRETYSVTKVTGAALEMVRQDPRQRFHREGLIG